MRRKAFRRCTGLFMAAAMLAASAFGGIFTDQIAAAAETSQTEDSFVFDFTKGGSEYVKEQIAEKYGEAYVTIYEDMIDQLAYATTSNADFGSTVEFTYTNKSSSNPSGLIPAGTSYQTAKDQLLELGLVLVYDNPQLYWLGGNVGILVNGYPSNYKVTVKFYSVDKYKPASKRLETNARIVDAVSDLYYSMAGFNKDFFRIAVLNDRLCAENKYDVDGTNDNRYNIEGCLLDHLCVCDGYAKTQGLMLNLFGINTVKIAGGNHAWNAIQLDGTWYYSDATFNDVIINGSVDNDNSEYWRKYFLKSEATFDATDTEDGGASQHLNPDALYEHLDNPPVPQEDYVYTDNVELVLPDELADEQVTLEVQSSKAYLRPDVFCLSGGVIDYQSLDDGEYTFTVYSDSTVARQYSVTVFGGAPTTELEFELCMLGDTNADAAVNTQDISVIKSFLKRTGSLDGYSARCADTSGDDVIDLADVLLIKAYLKGLISL